MQLTTSLITTSVNFPNSAVHGIPLQLAAFCAHEICKSLNKGVSSSGVVANNARCDTGKVVGVGGLFNATSRSKPGMV